MQEKKINRDEPLKASSSRLIHWFKLDQFEPERALTSHFVPSKTLFFIRLPLALYSLILLWVDIICTAKSGGFRHFFAYFTDLTFIGLHAYLMTTIVHHARYLWRSEHQVDRKRPSSFLDQMSILNYFYVYLYHTIIVFNIVTPVVFWTLLAKKKLFEAHLSPVDFWISVSIHTATFFTMMIDVLLNRMVVYVRMIFLVFSTIILYMCLAFVIFATEQWFVYDFLDWRVGPSACIWYLVVAVFIVVCFFFQVGLHKLRDWIASKTLKKYKCSTRATNDPEKDRKSFEIVEKLTTIHQDSGFNPLISTITGTSHSTFSASSTEQPPASHMPYY